MLLSVAQPLRGLYFYFYFIVWNQDKCMVALFMHACWLLRRGADESVGAVVDSTQSAAFGV